MSTWANVIKIFTVVIDESIIKDVFISNVFHVTDKYILYRMIVDPDQEYWIQYKEGWSRPSGLASFGAKVASMECIRVL